MHLRIQYKKFTFKIVGQVRQLGKKTFCRKSSKLSKNNSETDKENV